MDIAALRNDTPGCNFKTHFNNAGCSLHTKTVTDIVKNALTEEALTGGYEYAEQKSDDIYEFYLACAKLLQCTPENIAFSNSATDAFAKALSSIPFKENDYILTTENDYVSNQLQFLSLQKRFGIKIIRAENSPTGEVDINSIHDNIKKYNPALISVTHVPSNSGMVQPIAEIGKLAKEYNMLYMVDACQSAGQLDLNVNDIHCDFLSATMRKFMRGPRGSGFLYVSDKALQMNLEPLFIDMRGAEWTEANSYKAQNTASRFEYIEISYPILLGAAAAIHYACNLNLLEIEKRNNELSTYARIQLKSIPHIRLLDKGSKLCNIITIHSDGINIFDLKTALQQRNINTSIATKKNAVIDFTGKNVEGALRISPHYYNTMDEIDFLVSSLHEIIGG